MLNHMVQYRNALIGGMQGGSSPLQEREPSRMRQ
jgi:hypothetical protein